MARGCCAVLASLVGGNYMAYGTWSLVRKNKSPNTRFSFRLISPHLKSTAANGESSWIVSAASLVYAGSLVV